MPKCTICEKRFKRMFLDMYTCQCNLVFCSDHLHNHQCTFDMKSQHQNHLKKKMTKLKKVKINPI